MRSIECFGRKALWVFLPLFLSSCQSSSCPWEFHYTKGCDPSFYSKQIMFTRQSNVDVVELEILESDEGLRMFMNLHVCPVNPDSDGLIELTCKIGERTQICNTSVLEGGQRLLLDEVLASDIITALNDGQNVILEVDLYRICLSSSNFPRLWKKMNKD